MRKVTWLELLLVIITVYDTPVYAEYTITSRIDMKETYNDNIFLESINEEDDFILTVSPNITFNYSSGKMMDFTLDYGLNFRYYDRNSQLNDENITDVLDITANSRIKLSNRIFINIADKFDRVLIDTRRKTADNNYQENMTSKNIFSVSPNVILHLTDTATANIGYSYTNTYYKDPSSVDSDNHSASFILGKKFSPRINGSVQYEYNAYRPDRSDVGSDIAMADYDSHAAYAAIVYLITPTVRINGQMGEVWFEYQNDDDVRKFFWSIGTETDNFFKISENTSFGFNYGIQFRHSPTSGTYKNQELNLHFETGRILKLEIDPYYRDNVYLLSDRKDRFIGVTIALSRPITRKIDVSIDGKVEKKEFLPEDEDARNYSVGSDIHYSLNRRMEISMGYRFNRQNASSDISNEDLEINDYRNNIAWLQASLTF